MAQEISTHDMHETHEEHGHHGPTRSMYIKIGALLAALTVVEVLLYIYEAQLGHTVVFSSLLILTVGKFFLVGAYFMHLMFDKGIILRVFLICMGTAGLLLFITGLLWFMPTIRGVFVPTF